MLRDAWDEVRAHVALVTGERERVTREIGRVRGAAAMPSEANFVWVRTDKPAETVHAAMVARGVLVRSFRGGGRMAQQLRVTIGMPEENDAMLAALEAACA